MACPTEDIRVTTCRTETLGSYSHRLQTNKHSEDNYATGLLCQGQRLRLGTLDSLDLEVIFA